jgi:hypothetical protein
MAFLSGPSRRRHGERLDTLGGQAAQIAGISERAEAKAERGNVAMGLQDRQHLDRAALTRNCDGLAGDQPVLVEGCGFDQSVAGREFFFVSMAIA